MKPDYTGARRVGLVVKLMASGVIIAASFMPWLGTGGGRTWSGWNLYEFQRDSGNNLFLLPDFFTFPDGGRRFLFTGLATVVSGLLLMATTIVGLALGSLLRRRNSFGAHWAILMLMLDVAALAAPLVIWIGYPHSGDAPGAEYGLTVLKGATFTAMLGSFAAASCVARPPVRPTFGKMVRQFFTSIGFVVVTLLVVMAGVDALQNSGRPVSYQEFRIAEQDIEPRQAVAYDSGADFVDALNRAGVACTNPTILPVTTSAASGTIRVGDIFTCTFAKDDLVNVFVASPDIVGRAYFSSYFEASRQAAADVSSKSVTLKGEFWVANAADDQRLFEIQQALGGQLIAP